MAIAKNNGAAPYIHSNVDHFNANIAFNATDAIVDISEIKRTIQSLNKIYNDLKEEAEKFLMGMGLNEVNADILRISDTYAGLAADIIQDPEVIKSLVVNFNINVEDIKKQVFKEGNSNEKAIQEQILKEIGSAEQISIGRLARIVAKSFTIGSGSQGILKVTETGTRIGHFFEFDPSLEKEIIEAANEGVYKRLRTSTSESGIIKRIRDLLKKSSLVNANVGNSIDNFMSTFSKVFYDRAKTEIKIYPIDLTPEQYIKQLEKELRKDLTKDIIDIRNAAGLINENILADVYKADTSTTVKISFTPVGTMTEKDIIKQFPSLHEMKSHHLESKQSQSDMILKNQKGMIVRAQSKTSISGYKIEDKETEKMLNYLQRSVKVYDLLQNLNKVSAFHIGNIDEICYVMANALWFNTHISVSGIRDAGHFTFKRKGVYGGNAHPEIFREVADALNAELARQIPSFLGVSVERTIDEITADVKASNIFYIENGRLVPTYLQLQEVINDLQEYVDSLNQIKSLKITIEQRSGGVAWAESNAVKFWLKKNEHDQYDPTFGFTQGEAAISSISVHGNFYAISRFTSFPIGK